MSRHKVWNHETIEGYLFEALGRKVQIVCKDEQAAKNCRSVLYHRRRKLRGSPDHKEVDFGNLEIQVKGRIVTIQNVTTNLIEVTL